MLEQGREGPRSIVGAVTLLETSSFGSSWVVPVVSVMIMITLCLCLREGKAHLRIVRFCRQLLIDQREIGLDCPKLISSRKVLIAGFHVFSTSIKPIEALK
ncbi:hypothetical protein ACJW31_11G131100 [Castanea mollissima]